MIQKKGNNKIEEKELFTHAGIFVNEKIFRLFVCYSLKTAFTML